MPNETAHIVPNQAWDARQVAFQRWLAEPFDREPPTQGLLAEELGVHPQTLTRWKQLDGWDDAVNEYLTAGLKKQLPKLMKAGVRHAMRGDYRFWAAIMRLGGYDVDGNTATDQRTQIAITFNASNAETVTYENNNSQSGLLESGENGDETDAGGAASRYTVDTTRWAIKGTG